MVFLWRADGCHKEGTLILSYIRRLGQVLGFQRLNFNIYGVFSKWIYFGFGSPQNWTILGVISICILGTFSVDQCTEWEHRNIMPTIPYIFLWGGGGGGGYTVDAGSNPM